MNLSEHLPRPKIGTPDLSALSSKVLSIRSRHWYNIIKEFLTFNHEEEAIPILFEDPDGSAGHVLETGIVLVLPVQHIVHVAPGEESQEVFGVAEVHVL